MSADTVDVIVRDGKPVGYITAEEFAKKHNIARCTISQWIRRKKIFPLYIGKNIYLPENLEYPKEIVPRRLKRKSEPINDFAMTFGAHLFQAIVEEDISQTKLSEITGIDYQAISEYVNGRRIPRLDKAMTIARALNTSLDWLCGIQEATSDA